MSVRRLLVGIACGAGVAYAVSAYARSQRRIEWTNRVVIITGGSRGLGLVIARKLIAEGARLAICARDAEELERARAELAAQGDDVFAQTCDVNRPSQIEQFVQSVLEHFGQIDVLINNAGIIQVGPSDNMELADYEQAMTTNFWGALHFVNAVLPNMKARGGGRIVNVASIGGKISVPHMLPYSASKFALVGYSTGLRSELAKDNILITTVCPHVMRTGSHHQARFKGNHKAEFSWFSLGATLPFLSMSAESAASSIIDATQHGDAEATLSVKANAVTRLHALFPELSAKLLTIVCRTMPQPSAEHSETQLGRDSHSWLTPSILTTLGERAAVRNNELS